METHNKPIFSGIYHPDQYHIYNTRHKHKNSLSLMRTRIKSSMKTFHCSWTQISVHTCRSTLTANQPLKARPPTQPTNQHELNVNERCRGYGPTRRNRALTFSRSRLMIRRSERSEKVCGHKTPEVKSASQRGLTSKTQSADETTHTSPSSIINEKGHFVHYKWLQLRGSWSRAR